MPKVSVLMPVYNTNEKYLLESIESILSQTYKNFELIILDDNSTDKNLEKIIKSYQDDRILYVRNEQNLGISLSRNKLLDLATGEYLAVMDHDDISLKDRFVKQVEFLDSNPNVGVVGCYVNYMQKNKKITYPVNNKEIQEALFFGCCICHPASMIRKSVLVDNNLKYESEFSPSEDYALWCKLIGKTEFYNIPEVLFHYRDHAENTTSKRLDRMIYTSDAVRNLVRKQHSNIWEILSQEAIVSLRIKLFGLIPFLKIVKQKDEIKYFLFYYVLIFHVQIKSHLKKI